MSDLYSVFLKLEGKPCLVVGGGSVSTRKVEILLSSGAKVRVVSPSFDAKLLEHAKANKNLSLDEKKFEAKDLAEMTLVIAATNDRRVNRQVFECAKTLGLMVNVADEPDLCDFYLPSLLKRGPLTIAVSTGGACPALAKKIRQSLEKQFDARYEALAGALSEIRQELIKKYPDDTKKRGSLMAKLVDTITIDKMSPCSKEDLIIELRKWI